MSQQGTVQSFNYEPAQLVPHSPSAASSQQTPASSPQSQYASSGGQQSNQPNDDSVVMNNGMPIPVPEQERDEAGYLNGLDYTICFRKEIGFCTQTYYINSTTTPFEILNSDNCKCYERCSNELLKMLKSANQIPLNDDQPFSWQSYL